jgi:hypothetical protein
VDRERKAAVLKADLPVDREWVARAWAVLEWVEAWVDQECKAVPAWAVPEWAVPEWVVLEWEDPEWVEVVAVPVGVVVPAVPKR